MLEVDKLRALYQRAGMSAADSHAAVRNTGDMMVPICLGTASLGSAANALSGAFVWAESPEGHAHWERVHARLSGVRE